MSNVRRETSNVRRSLEFEPSEKYHINQAPFTDAVSRLTFDVSRLTSHV